MAEDYCTETKLEKLEGPITRYMEQREFEGFRVDIWSVGGTEDSMARVAIHVGKQMAWLVNEDDTIEEEIQLKWNSGMVNTFGAEYEIKRQLIWARIQMDHLLVADIASLRKLAMDHYNEGGDSVVECWEDADIAQHIWYDPNTAKSRMLENFIIFDELRTDVQNS